MTLKHLFSYYYTLHNIKIPPITSPLLSTTENGYRTNLAQFSMVCSKCRVSNIVTTHYQLILSYSIRLCCSNLFSTTPIKLNAENKSLKNDLAQLTLRFIITQFSSVSRNHLILKFLDVKWSHHAHTHITSANHVLHVSTDNLTGIDGLCRYLSHSSFHVSQPFYCACRNHGFPSLIGSEYWSYFRVHICGLCGTNVTWPTPHITWTTSTVGQSVRKLTTFSITVTLIQQHTVLLCSIYSHTLGSFRCEVQLSHIV
jgi:hypothetical protein